MQRSRVELDTRSYLSLSQEEKNSLFSHAFHSAMRRLCTMWQESSEDNKLMFEKLLKKERPDAKE